MELNLNDQEIESGKKRNSLQAGLAEIFNVESIKKANIEELTLSSGLLLDLVTKQQLNTLIINLYIDFYSIMLRNEASELETNKIPYQDGDILDYIDTQLIPPNIIDLLDQLPTSLYVSGCLVAEVRDFRCLTDNSFETSYVLLKPHNHTIINDMNLLTSMSSHRWTETEKNFLESQLILHSTPPLCLDTSPSLYSVHNQSFQPLNHLYLLSKVRQCSQRGEHQRLELSMGTPCVLGTGIFGLLKCIEDWKKKEDESGVINLIKNIKVPVDNWIEPSLSGIAPANLELQQKIRPIERQKISIDNQPVLLEQFEFETERAGGRVSLSKVSIHQRMSDEVYIGSLYLNKDSKQSSAGASCRFKFASYSGVEKYIRQFREIITEEGRRQVKITHYRANNPPIVTYTNNNNDGKNNNEDKYESMVKSEENKDKVDENEKSIYDQTNNINDASNKINNFNNKNNNNNEFPTNKAVPFAPPINNNTNINPLLILQQQQLQQQQNLQQQQLQQQQHLQLQQQQYNFQKNLLAQGINQLSAQQQSQLQKQQQQNQLHQIQQQNWQQLTPTTRPTPPTTHSTMSNVSRLSTMPRLYNPSSNTLISPSSQLTSPPILISPQMEKTLPQQTSPHQQVHLPQVISSFLRRPGAAINIQNNLMPSPQMLSPHNNNQLNNNQHSNNLHNSNQLQLNPQQLQQLQQLQSVQHFNQIHSKNP